MMPIMKHASKVLNWINKDTRKKTKATNAETTTWTGFLSNEGSLDHKSILIGKMPLMNISIESGTQIKPHMKNTGSGETSATNERYKAAKEEKSVVIKVFIITNDQ